MKLTLLIVATLVVVIVAGLWCWRHSLRNEGAPRLRAEAERVAPASHKQRSADESDRQPVSIQIEGLSAAIQVLVDRDANYSERVAVIGAINSQPSMTDQQGLQLFLVQWSPEDESPAGQALKNKLMDALCELNPSPAWLEEILTQVYSDRNQHVVLRDYAVQHLVSLSEAMSGSAVDSAALSDSIRAVLWEATGEIDSSIAGTALLGLARLAELRPDLFNRERVGRESLRLVRERGASELSRIAAFQVCGRLKVKEVLPLAREAAENGETVAVQISAINVLGGLRAQDARPLLTKLLNGPEERLKLPVRRALNEIEQQEQPNRTSNRKT